MVQFSYLIVCNDDVDVKEILPLLENFPDYYCVGTITTKEKAINAILEYRPNIVFLYTDSKTKNDLTLDIITELHQYINQLPAIVVVADNEKLAFNAIKSGVFDYLVKPVNIHELRKCMLKYQKFWSAVHHKYVDLVDEAITEDLPAENNDRSAPDTPKSDIDIQICIKSYGDYQFIALKDVVYLEADNNTTDFYLITGKKLSAYKTLKHYENNLPSFFYRIHNSYIVNSSYVSRINTGKQLCYLNNNEISVSFSKTFKDNIDTIIRTIAPEYL